MNYFNQRTSWGNIWGNAIRKVRENPTVPVPDWLSARYLLRSLDENVIISCYDEIIDSFKTKKNTIHTLVRAATTKQIKTIIQILKEAQLKEIEKNNNKILNKFYNDTNNKSYFDYLSTESVSNIIKFLNKNDIKQFKMTSTSNALIVFDIMKTFTIHTLNMNELIEQKDYKYGIEFNINDKIKMNRIKPFSTYKTLTNLYCKRYHILSDNLLILQSVSHISLAFHNVSIIKNILACHQQKIQQGQVFFVFDKKKIIILNNTKKVKNMAQVYKSQEMKNYKVVLLQFFDIEIQRIENVKYLFMDTNTSLSRFQEFILNDLDLKNKIKLSVWKNIDKMKKFGSHINETLINIYNPWKGNDYKQFRICIFELNYDHPYFKSINIIQNVPLKVTEFINDQHAKYPIYIKHIHKNMTMLRQQIKFFNADFNNNSFISQKLKLIVTPLTTFGVIRKWIANKFKHISFTNIEIYHCMQCYDDVISFGFKKETLSCVSDSQTIGERKMITNEYVWNIVPYDTTNRQSQPYKIMKVNIYEHNISTNYDNIFHFPTTSIQTAYINIVDDEKEKESYGGTLLTKVMNFISHPMYGNLYKNVKDKYKNKEKYSFIMMTQDDINNKKYKCYDTNDKFTIQYATTGDLNGMNLLITQNINYELKKFRIPIFIRFCELKQKYKYDKKEYTVLGKNIGFPIKIWISKDCTLQMIVDQYLKDFETFKKFKAFSCSSSKYGKLNSNHKIYETIYNDKTEENTENEFLIAIPLTSNYIDSAVEWSFST